MDTNQTTTRNHDQATPEVIDPSTLSAKGIATWALGNKERAKAVGQRIFDFQSDPEGLLAQPSLGAYEDAMISWAVKNPKKARLLMLKLAPKLLS
jgi:hypothetical protein